jgi:hypothetical protein
MDLNHKDDGHDYGKVVEEGSGGFWATLVTALLLLLIVSAFIHKGIGGEFGGMFFYIVLLSGLGVFFNGTIG